jgi:hypothetical protein
VAGHLDLAVADSHPARSRQVPPDPNGPRFGRLSRAQQLPDLRVRRHSVWIFQADNGGITAVAAHPEVMASTIVWRANLIVGEPRIKRPYAAFAPKHLPPP